MYEDRTEQQSAAASTIDELQPPTPASPIDTLQPQTAADGACDGNCSYCWGPETD